jgi:hypothetical protein
MVLKECLARLKQAKLKPCSLFGGYKAMPKIFELRLEFGNTMLFMNKLGG